MLCSTHHRALHNGEFFIRALGDQEFSFHRPGGSLIETAPHVDAPANWRPDTNIAPDAVEPVGGGRLDLGYTLEVLYAAWEWRDGQQTTAIAA